MFVVTNAYMEPLGLFYAKIEDKTPAMLDTNNILSRMRIFGPLPNVSP